MKKLIILSLLLLSGCLSGGNSTEDTEAFDSKDITGVIFSNRSSNCAEYMAAYTSQAKDLKSNETFNGSTKISVVDGKCIFSANAIPNHDVNDSSGRGFANPMSAQDQVFEVTSSPRKADQNTALTLQYDNAIMLNGVKVDLLAAGCFGVGDGKIGCTDTNQAWRYDPMSANSDFGADSHNAHTQPNGAYHYHGDPMALYKNDASVESPVIGFAADGFPIYGPFAKVDGEIRRVRSSYQLKSGARPSESSSPGGDYDGTFVDDFEYKTGSGDLDECNGREVKGQYAYYVTSSYPHILGCFKGTPDPSFKKQMGRRPPQ